MFVYKNIFLFLTRFSFFELEISLKIHIQTIAHTKNAAALRLLHLPILIQIVNYKVCYKIRPSSSTLHDFPVLKSFHPEVQ